MLVNVVEETSYLTAGEMLSCQDPNKRRTRLASCSLDATIMAEFK